MVARNIVAVLLFLALIGRRVDCQLEDAESQNRLCPALYGGRNLHSFLYLSDIVFYGKVLETYKGFVCVCVCVCMCHAAVSLVSFVLMQELSLVL